jgi:Leucine-rich repeat (LRR) protein
LDSRGDAWEVKALEESAAKRREPYEALLEVEELHMLYEDEVKHAELALEGLEEPSVSTVEAEEEVDEYVASKLQEALENQLDTLDLSSQFLSYVPESFGRISSLVILNLSNNRLEVSTCIFHPIQCRFDTSFM